MSNVFDLSNKNAIVVGGCGDLGRATVHALVEAGAKVFVIELCEAIENSKIHFKDFVQRKKVEFTAADIRDRKQITESFQKALKFCGGQLDILVNSAGVQRRYPSEKFPVEDWDDVLRINLDPIFLYCQLAANVMIPRKQGKIINFASLMSFLGGITIPAYSASKGAVSQLTKAFSNDWACYGLQVNAIAPGYMDTNLNIKIINDPVRINEVMARVPAKRWGKPDDIKGAIVFLASAASDFITGIVMPVDGGYLSR
jgi:2-deoxy-D-gluconate 3-dehydrogenase